MDTSPLKIGYCLSLSGTLASNGKTAQLAHQIWLEKVNRNGRLLGRRVELVCLDDETNPNLVADLYRRLGADRGVQKPRRRDQEIAAGQ